MDALLPAPAPADASESSAGKLATQATANMQALTSQLLQALQKQSTAATASYLQLLQSVEQTTAHQYNVFQVASPPRYLVLRDVSELNGAPPVYPQGTGAPPVYPPMTFAGALAWVNSRMRDGIGRSPGAKIPPVTSG